MPELIWVHSNRLYVASGLDGSIITSYNFQADGKGYHHPFSHGPTIADIDNDGTAEIFFNTGNQASGAPTNTARQWINAVDYDGGTLTHRYRVSYGQANVSSYDGQKWSVPQMADYVNSLF